MTAEARARRLHGLSRALRLGVWLFLGVAVLGQLIGLAVFVARGGDGSLAEHAGIGWLYFNAFHGVPLDVVPTDPGIVATTRVTLALLLPTLAVLWAAFAAGRSVAREAVGPAPSRVAMALLVAVPYAAGAFVVSSVVDVHLAFTVTDNLFGGPVDVAVDPVVSGVATFAIVAIPALAGALGAIRRPDLRAVRRVYAAIAGGVLAVGVGLVLAFVGLLVNAGADPETARAYFATVADTSPAGTAIIVAHHVLVLPNQSVWVLAPAMGGADRLRIEGTERTLVSYAASVTELGVGVPSGAGVAPALATEPLPRWYLLFLLVPGLSTVLGGRRAAEVARSLAGALALGAAAGVVFAALIGVASLLSDVTWRAVVSAGDALEVSAGPDPRRAAMLALAWGIAGGVVGAVWRWRVSER